MSRSMPAIQNEKGGGAFAPFVRGLRDSMAIMLGYLPMATSFGIAAIQVGVAPNVDLVACQQAAENSARSARLGLWRQSPIQSVAQLKRSGFAVVSGRVSQVKRNRGGIWIEMQGSLVLRVSPALVSQFDAVGLNGLQGRTVEARGWVQDRSRRGGLKKGQARWLLPLTDPSMLKSTH